MSTFRKLHFKGFRRLTLMIAVMALLATTFTGCFGKKEDPNETENNIAPPNLIQTETQAVEETKPVETEPPKAQVTVSPEGDKATVSGAAINIMEDARAQGKVVGHLEAGETVDILRDVELNGISWGFICFERNGKNEYGWICLDNVDTQPNLPENNGGDTDKPSIIEKPNGEDTPAPTTTPVETKPADKKPNNNNNNHDTTRGDAVSLKGIVTGSQLNIREQPTTDSEIVGSLNAGTRVSISEKKDGWGKINKGWISLKYVYLDGNTGNNPAKGVVIADTLNVRSGPGTDHEKVNSYSYGKRVNVLEQFTIGNTKWGCTKDGWIAMDYVYVDGTTGEGSGKGTVTGSQLNIRSGPGTEFESLGAMNKGDRVDILTQIQVGNMKWGCTSKGWISMDYVDMD